MNVVDLLRLGEGDIDIGVTILFRNGGEINGAWIHVILGLSDALFGVLQDDFEVFSGCIDGGFRFDCFAEVSHDADEGGIAIISGGPAKISDFCIGGRCFACCQRQQEKRKHKQDEFEIFHRYPFLYVRNDTL